MPIFYPCQQFARCSSAKVDTKQLANLRRGTGYGLSTCREALLENDNDIEAAQAWLDAQAVKKGWQKAAKLEDRKVGEGLVGVLVENNHAAMVEVNMEGACRCRNFLNCSQLRLTCSSSFQLVVINPFIFYNTDVHV